MSGERLLVVDDSAQMRDFLANSVLKMEGYVIDVARDGIEGLATALTSPPDLIVTDLAMPEMNGLEMVEELRNAGHQIPVILMTAEGSEDIAVRALRAGVMDYFVKPFDDAQLAEAVARILRAGRIGALQAGVPDQRRLQALNTLIAVGKSVTSLLDLELILSRVVEAAIYLAGAEEGTLMLVDPDSGELYVRAAKNLEQDLVRSLRLPVTDSLAGRVVETGEPLLIGGEGMQKIKTRYLVRSLLYVPLRVKDHVIGVLGVDNRLTDRVISQQDVGIITALADYAAIAIVNAQLYTEANSQRNKLNRILRQTEDAVLVISPEGRVDLCNAIAREMFVRSEGGDPVGQWLSDVVDNHSLLELLERRPGEHGIRGEIDLKDGRTFNAQVSEIEGVGRVIVMQDITHLKELDRIKSEFVTTVSHDLRSPLTAILSYVELLGRVGELNEQQREFSQHVRQSVQSITSLINDLLELGKIEAGLDRQREPVYMTLVVRYVIEALQGQMEIKKLQIALEAPEALPQVLGNPIRLRQAVANLVDNAIKYTLEGGTINLQLFAEEEQVVIRIADTGIGISLADQPYIFDKFYRANEVVETHDGTGLGLSIVKSIVEAHDGRIWVESQPGQGTAFTIMLPAYFPEEARIGSHQQA